MKPLATTPIDQPQPPVENNPGEAFLIRIANELAQGPLNLPCFPDIVPRVRKALDNPNSTVNDIVKIAGTEPRLAARLLQTANSTVFNPTGMPHPNLRSAVTRLGHQLVQSITMAFAMQQMKTEPTLQPVIKPLSDLWERSIAVASICQSLAKRLRVPADKVFLTGLLHGIGRFYMLVRSVEPTSEVNHKDLSTDLVNKHHPALGRAVLMKWGMESIVCDAIGMQHDYARESSLAADINDVLIASIVLGEALFDLEGDLIRCENVTAFARMGLSNAELQAILKHTKHSLDALRAALTN